MDYIYLNMDYIYFIQEWIRIYRTGFLEYIELLLGPKFGMKYLPLRRISRLK